MHDPTEPFDFPDLPDEAVIAINDLLEDLYVRFRAATSRRCTATTTTAPTVLIRTSIRCDCRCPNHRSEARWR
jgi:hypothetical protein